jgi:hypothetical protein
MELAKLGFRVDDPAPRGVAPPWRIDDVDKNTVARYVPKPGRRPRPPTQTWTTFIRNHLSGTLAIDFFTVPTVTFDILYVLFVVLSLERRRVCARAVPSCLSFSILNIVPL